MNFTITLLPYTGNILFNTQEILDGLELVEFVRDKVKEDISVDNITVFHEEKANIHIRLTSDDMDLICKCKQFEKSCNSVVYIKSRIIKQFIKPKIKKTRKVHVTFKFNKEGFLKYWEENRFKSELE